MSCDEWTTFTIEHNKFHLVAEEGGSLPKRHVYALENVRFLVLSGVFQSDVALSFTTGVGNMIQVWNFLVEYQWRGFVCGRGGGGGDGHGAGVGVCCLRYRLV